MIDFKLTANGDIDLGTASQYPTCRLDFYMKPYPCLRLDFDTDSKQYDIRPYGVEFNFHTNVRKLPSQKQAVTAITGQAETAQEILVRLKTEQGEYAVLPGLGSRLVLERHKDIRSSTVQETVREYAEEAIGDVVFEEEPVTIVTWVDDEESRFRHETLKITIDTGNTTCFEGTI